MTSIIREETVSISGTFHAPLKYISGNHGTTLAASVNDAALNIMGFSVATLPQRPRNRDGSYPSMSPVIAITANGGHSWQYADIPLIKSDDRQQLGPAPYWIYAGDINVVFSRSIDCVLVVDDNGVFDQNNNQIFMPSFGGPAGVIDPPTYRQKRLRYAPKPGGRTRLTLTAGGATISYDDDNGVTDLSGTVGYTIQGEFGVVSSAKVALETDQPEDQNIAGDAATGVLQVHCNVADYAVDYHYAYNGCSINGLSASVPSAPGYGESHSASVSFNNFDNFYGHISPRRTWSVAGHLAAMNKPYPNTLEVQVDGIRGQQPQKVAGSGRFGASGVQRSYAVRGLCDGRYDPDWQANGGYAEEYAPLRCWLTPGAAGDGNQNTLLAHGEDPTDWRILLHGFTFPGLEIGQAGSINVDAAPATAGWIAGPHTSISGVLDIAVVSPPQGQSWTGSVSSVLPTADASLKGSNFAGVSFSGYRYLRLNLTADDENLPARVRLGSKTWDIKASGQVDIDLCCPTNNMVTTDTFDTQWPFGSATNISLSDGPLFGVSNVSNFVLENLSAGHVYTLSNVQLVRKDHSTLTCLPERPGWIQKYPVYENSSEGSNTTTSVRRYFQGDTDGRQSIELEDAYWLHFEGAGGLEKDDYIDVSIQQVADALHTNATYPANGWTATASIPVPTSGCGSAPPLRDCGLNAGLASAYLYGGGLLFGSHASVTYGMDIDCSATATIPAQELFDELMDWPPGCGDVFGFGDPANPSTNAIVLCAGKILRGNAWGLLVNDKSKPVANVQVKLTKTGSSPAEDDGSATSDGQGEYRQSAVGSQTAGSVGTGMPFGVGGQTYTAQPQSGSPRPSVTLPFASRKRHRASFAVVTQKTCCDQLFCSGPVFFPFTPQRGDHDRLPLESWRAIPDGAAGEAGSDSSDKDEEDEEQRRSTLTAVG